jgi:hypothetical protein
MSIIPDLLALPPTVKKTFFFPNASSQVISKILIHGMVKQQIQEVRNINPLKSQICHDIITRSVQKIKQSEANTINIMNEKSEELKPLVVYDIDAKDGITETDTSIATKKSISVLPYDDKDEVMTSNPFLAAISFWRLVSSMEYIL